MFGERRRRDLFAGERLPVDSRKEGVSLDLGEPGGPTAEALGGILGKQPADEAEGARG